MAATTLPDGRYMLAPEGSDVEYIDIRSGRVLRRTSRCLMDTHLAANDSRSDMADGEDCGEELCTLDHAALVRLAEGPDADPRDYGSAYIGD